MTEIKQEIIKQVKASQKATARLAYEFAKDTVTINRWLDKKGNWEMLTTDKALNAISEELDIEKTEILTEA